MTSLPPDISSVVRAVASGAYIISDNDGTLAPFTQRPDQTVIPRDTLDAIESFRRAAGPARFIIATGRDLGNMEGVLRRSGNNASLPILSDDGAIFTANGQSHFLTTPAERQFTAFATAEVKSFVEKITRDRPHPFSLTLVEYKNNSLGINTNAVHAHHGAEAAEEVRQSFRDVFRRVCQSSPQHEGQPCFGLFQPPGRGIEIRSHLTTKRRGIEVLIEKGILPADKPLVFLGDDIGKDGNDVALARLVRERGGIFIQVRRTDPSRAFPDSAREVEPDIVLHGPLAAAPFLKSVTNEYVRALSPPPPKPKPF